MRGEESPSRIHLRFSNHGASSLFHGKNASDLQWSDLRLCSLTLDQYSPLIESNIGSATRFVRSAGEYVYGIWLASSNSPRAGSVSVFAAHRLPQSHQSLLARRLSLPYRAMELLSGFFSLQCFSFEIFFGFSYFWCF